MGKLKFILICTAILAMPGWESAHAAQPNGFKNFMNNLDRKRLPEIQRNMQNAIKADSYEKEANPTAHSR